MARLLEWMRGAIRVRQYSLATGQNYLRWVQRFILFHDKRHPEQMGKEEIEAFLIYLVVRRRIPVVRSVAEAKALLAECCGDASLPVALMYGSGLRAMECLRLRVGDLDMNRRTIRVHAGKGGKDRITVLPDRLVDRLTAQVAWVRSLHRRDLAVGLGEAKLPRALRRKFGKSSRRFYWQYVFPSRGIAADPRQPGRRCRWHIHPTTVRKAVSAAAIRAGIQKRVTCHRLRHSFATHLLESGTDIRTIRQLLGHRDVRTTMVYTHVVQRGAFGARSPLDA